MRLPDQRARILALLQAGEKLTPLEALQRGLGLRLGARVLELRRAGHKIVTSMVDVTTADGKTARVARYHLEPGPGEGAP